MTRSAARLGFVVLLVGAGAAAVAARPLNETNRRLEIVAGDSRLDMAWALAQRGMTASDAARVSVLLVDQVDPTTTELATLQNAVSAELWWQSDDVDAPPRMHMVRALLDFHWGLTLQGTIAAHECDGGRTPFLVMKSLGSPELPIPRDAVVLVRIFDPWTIGADKTIGRAALAPIGSTASVECLPVVVDLDHGVAAPLR